MNKYKTKKTNCKCCICDKPIYRPPSKLKALVDGKPVCSRKCGGIKKTQKHIKNNVECAICGKEMYRAPHEIKSSKTGEFVCSREHYAILQSKQSQRKIEKRLGIKDLKEWLSNKYHDEQLNSRDISELMYGNRTNGPNVIGWMDNLGVPTRDAADAVALQWKNNPERREAQRQQMKNIWAKDIDGNLRTEIIEVMQTKEYRHKQSVSKMGKRNGMYGMTGIKSPRWNHELTEEDRLHTRKYQEYTNFRKAVFERDGYTCQRCQSKRGGDLVAHHINGYHWDKDNRTEVDNGATLCEKCHKEFHSIYGYGNNDLFQFAQFMDLTLTK